MRLWGRASQETSNCTKEKGGKEREEKRKRRGKEKEILSHEAHDSGRSSRVRYVFIFLESDIYLYF